MKTKTTITGIALTAAIVFITIVCFHLSTWFLWYLLPQGNWKLAVNSSEDGSEIINELAGKTLLPEKISTLTKKVKKYAYLQNKDYSAVAFVPKNPFLFHDRNIIINTLANHEWQTRNFGLIIIGTTKPDKISLPNLTATTKLTLDKLISRQHPRKPTIIADLQNSPIPYFKEQTSLVGTTARNGELKLIIAPTLKDLPDFSISGPPLPRTEDYLIINVPGQVIENLPQQLKNEWNEILHNKIGLKHTKPPLMEYLSRQQTIRLTIDETGTAITAIGKTKEIQNRLIKWLKAEEAFFRPEKNAFQLPDNTLGYETVPGAPVSIFSPPDLSNCLSPTSEHIKLWICQDRKSVSIATDKQMAVKETAAISPTRKDISLGNKYTKQLNQLSLPINSFLLHSSGKYTQISISQKP